MPQQLKILNFSFDPTGHVPADKLLPGDDLERDLLPGAVVDGQLYLAKGALAQRLEDLVGTDALLRLDILPRRRVGGIAHVHWLDWLFAAPASGGRGVILLGSSRGGLSPDVGRGQRDGKVVVLESALGHGVFLRGRGKLEVLAESSGGRQFFGGKEGNLEVEMEGMRHAKTKRSCRPSPDQR